MNNDTLSADDVTEEQAKAEIARIRRKSSSFSSRCDATAKKANA